MLPRRSISLLVVSLALTVSLVTTSAADAKNPHGGGDPSSSSLALVLLDSADDVAHAGQHVTFSVSTTATASPFVSLDCYQSGAWVYTASAGFFAAYPWPAVFTLSSTGWLAGDADCSARMYSTTDGRRTRTLATLSFHVSS